VGLIAAAPGATGARQATDYRFDKEWLELPTANEAGRADVFFIHPTTTLSLRVGNGAAGAHLFLNKLSLVNQASVFDRCCRIYAPRYRQMRLRSLAHDAEASDLAYADVRAAFENFLARTGSARPFLIAGHSQGSALGLRGLPAWCLHSERRVDRRHPRLRDSRADALPRHLEYGRDVPARPEHRTCRPHARRLREPARLAARR
jgi:hypothetical protein